MPETPIAIRSATPTDLVHLHPVIERAYRGDDARAGWSHEADLLSGQRTDMVTLQAILENADERLLVAERDGTVIGCVQITDRGAGTCYLGLLCIDPLLQAAGLGRQLIAAAETQAQQLFAAQRMEMAVIEQRRELIAYYERRGYRQSGERRDFPLVVTPPLFMTVLVKDMAVPLQ